jgi:circadian clock protein KaiB
VAAERNLRRLLSSYPALSAELEIRDVLVDPEAGLLAKVIATPTLLKVAPEPERRILGDLHDLDLLRDVLGLRDASHEASAE